MIKKQHIQQIMDQLEQIKVEMSKAYKEELKYYHSIPKNLKSSNLAKFSGEKIEDIKTAFDGIDIALTCLKDAKSYGIL